MTGRAPRIVLRAILDAPDMDAALTYLTRALGAAWKAGSVAGWDAGVSDATDDEPTPIRPNPYRKEK